MAENSSFRNPWQKARDLVETCYGVASDLPRSETFGLAAQLRRAAVSVPANIAEAQRLSKGAFRNYLMTALGSEAEIETHLELGRRRRAH
jgi:four helix bundle protein